MATESGETKAAEAKANVIVATTDAAVTDTAASFALPAKIAAPLAVASGLLFYFAFPGADLWPLCFVCWVPLLIAIRGQSVRRATWLGWLMGTTSTFTGFRFLIPTLKTFSGFPVAICLLIHLILCAYQAGRMALSTYLYARAERRGWPPGIVFALAFATGELVYPLLFPWFLGADLHAVPWLVQAADLTGPIGLGLAITVSSISVAELVWSRREHRALDRRRVVAGLLGPLALIVYGAIRLPMIDAAIAAAPKGRIAIIQGNMPLGATDSRDLDGATVHRKEQHMLEGREHVDLAVWPEGAVNYSVPVDTLEATLRIRARRGLDDRGVFELTTPTLTGVMTRRQLPGHKAGDRPLYYNSATLLDENGHSTGLYNKNYLEAFGEYLPFGDTFPKLYEISPNSGRLEAGTEFAALPFHGHTITPLICYEDILPGFTNRAVVATDPDLLVNLSNDAWFLRTQEPAIHLALSELRAVEHHRALVRATNSGISAFVDAAGRASGETRLFERTTTVGEIAWMRGRTLYEIVGDVPWWLATLASVVMATMRRDGRKLRFAIRSVA